MELSRRHNVSCQIEHGVATFSLRHDASRTVDYFILDIVHLLDMEKHTLAHNLIQESAGKG